MQNSRQKPLRLQMFLCVAFTLAFHARVALASEAALDKLIVNIDSCELTKAAVDNRNVVISFINYDERLVKIAEDAGRDIDAQRSINNLILKLRHWAPGQRIGSGSLHLGNSFYEMRSGAGRIVVYYRLKEHIPFVVVVGKSSKSIPNNENRMFDVLRRIYHLGVRPGRARN